jgi:uncharacterized protein YdhG (YjbR/CyaY superfamily)
MNADAPKSIDEYIAGFPQDIRECLEKIRATIRVAAPESEEKISYQMPTFALKGNLVHFAAFKTHIGFYPTSSGIAQFKKELSSYDCSKGTVRFPTGTPLPFELIDRIVQFRATENLAKAASKKEDQKPKPSLNSNKQ